MWTRRRGGNDGRPEVMFVRLKKLDCWSDIKLDERGKLEENRPMTFWSIGVSGGCGNDLTIVHFCFENSKLRVVCPLSVMADHPTENDDRYEQLVRYVFKMVLTTDHFVSARDPDRTPWVEERRRKSWCRPSRQTSSSTPTFPRSRTTTSVPSAARKRRRERPTDPITEAFAVTAAGRSSEGPTRGPGNRPWSVKRVSQIKKG